MSSLVAGYGSSEEEEESEDPAFGTERATPAPKSFLSDPDDVIPSVIPNTKISFTLPQPSTSAIAAPIQIDKSSGSEDIEIGPIPPKKIYGDEEQKPSGGGGGNPIPKLKSLSNFIKKSGTTGSGTSIKIGIPSLKDFDGDEDEPGSGSRKWNQNPQGSSSRSGLFAILPQPKRDSILSASSSFSKSSSAADSLPNFSAAAPVSLIPHSVKSATTKRPSGAISSSAADAKSKMAQVRAKYLKSESNFVFVSNKFKNPKQTDIDSEAAEEEEAGFKESKTSARVADDKFVATDFFSLSGSGDPDPEEHMGMEVDMDIPSSDEPVGPTRGDYNYEYAAAIAAAAEADEQAQAAAAERLASNFQISSTGGGGPKKHRGLGLPPEAASASMIEVRADDLRPEESTWLRTITDTSLIAPRKANLPGGATKRKHQITYLAAEAKAREEELKNQWASSRASKQQTMNKYGF